MLMRDVPIGEIVFLEENMDDERSHEIRETFYQRNGVATYLRLGLVQGDPTLAQPRLDEQGLPERPRYRRFNVEGYEYPLVPMLPVKPITASRFYQYVVAE